MFNLLPKAEKDAVRREYRIRLAVVILWFSSGTFLVASFLLLPSFFLSTEKERAALRQSETLGKSVEMAEAANLEKTLLTIKHKLSALAKEPPPLFLYEVLVRIAEKRPKGLSLDSFTVVTKEGKREVHIVGVAQSRTLLVAFERALSRSGLFEHVDLPVANLAKQSDSEFSLRGRLTF